MNWEDFFRKLKESTYPDHAAQPGPSATAVAPAPGKVMICFVNRYLKGIDGVKYRFRYDGREQVGTTTEQDYCFELQPRTTGAIHVAVWSTKSKAYKELDVVVPVIGRSQLIRKILDTAKVRTRTEKHRDAPAPRPKQPPPATPPGPSPESKQGLDSTKTANERQAPQTQAQRAVPGQVTLAQLRNIFTDPTEATDSYLQTVADEVNANLVTFKLDTPLRRAHFFAQIKGETGQSMKPKRENWEYSPAALMSFSKYYAAHPDEATADGYLKNDKKKIIRHANQDAIGKKHFAKLNGNRPDHPEDGSNFRGRGLLQITGYEKYSGFMKDYPGYWSGNAPDCVEQPDLIIQFPFSVRSALWFWLKYKVYAAADAGSTETVVTAVSRIVNGGSTGLKERKDAFQVSYRAFK